MIASCFNQITTYEFFSVILALVGTLSTIAAGFFKLGRWVARRPGNSPSTAAIRQELVDTKQIVLQARAILKVHIQRADDIENAIAGVADIWLRPTNHNFGQVAAEIGRGHPIIAVANFKGRVAKSTLAANLAAFFAKDLSKRVLLVDLDYQGTLSDNMLSAAGITSAESSAHKLLSADEDISAVFHQSVPLHSILPGCRIFPSFYDLARLENQIMLKWIVKKESTDARFNLHRYLHSEKFQESFDVTIIDAPPRLVTGMANAACAASHILIPSALDGKVVPATLNTIKVFHGFKSTICPSLNILGIAPTLISNQTGYNDREKRALVQLKGKLREFWPNGSLPHVFEEFPICRREDIAAAAGTEMYPFGSRNSVSSQMFANLGNSILARL